MTSLNRQTYLRKVAIICLERDQVPGRAASAQSHLMDKARSEAVPVLTEAMLRRLDVPGPRYTSYPTADRFVEAFGPTEYAQALNQRAQGAMVGGKAPLSLYVHIPFCESVCYYCACNKVITKHHDRAAEYLDVLEAEIGLHTAVLGSGQSVSQVHFGGGSA